MDENEKKELMDEMAGTVENLFSGLTEKIDGLKTDIETMKKQPDSDKTKLENEQDVIKLDDLSEKLNGVVDIVTGLSEKLTEKPGDKKSLIELIFG